MNRDVSGVGPNDVSVKGVSVKGVGPKLRTLTSSSAFVK